jgi:hypothetical protein
LEEEKRGRGEEEEGRWDEEPPWGGEERKKRGKANIYIADDAAEPVAAD